MSAGIGALLLAACARRPPVLVPPASGVEAVAGYAAASVHGETADVKGKFAFLFRRPGLGRVEVFDPLGRTVYYIVFTGQTAYLVVPGRKAYAEDRPAAMVARFLGFALGPDEALVLLSGQWPESAGVVAAGWALGRDPQGRVIRGERGGLVFEVAGFFPGAGVPRTVTFSRPGASGRLRVLSLEFNPAPRPGAFGTGFLKTFARRPVEELEGTRDDAP
ncbi:MAG TPA: hypothetical protein VMS75_04265 [Terriglobales bacterium]|nr:hypothetical protein [Terriglobales bacterium]